MDIFYEKQGFIKCWYDPEHQMIVQDYEEFIADIDEFKYQHDLCFEALVKYQARKWLTNTKQTTSAVPVELQEWVKNVHAPRCIEHGLKYLATVVPDSEVGKVTTRSWQAGVKEIGTLTTANFVRVEHAIAWLDNQK